MPRPQIIVRPGQLLFKPQLDNVLDYLDRGVEFGGDGNSDLTIIDQAGSDAVFLEGATNTGAEAVKFTVPPGEVVYLQVPANSAGVNPYSVHSTPFTVHRTPARAATKNIHTGFAWWTFGEPFTEFGSGTLGYQVGYWMNWWGSSIIVAGVTQTVAETLATVTTNIKGIVTTGDRLYLASAYSDDAGFLMGFYSTHDTEDLVVYMPIETFYWEDA